MFNSRNRRALFLLALLAGTQATMDINADGGGDDPPSPKRTVSPAGEMPSAQARRVDAAPLVDEVEDPDVISVKIAMSKDGGSVTVYVPEGEMLDDENPKHVPTDICCVVDVSGSMRTEATLGDKATKESKGLTVLDITKHAVKTVAKLLGPEDTLTVVTFSNDCVTRFPQEKMTPAGQDNAIRVIDTIQVEGQTDLFGGLRAGLQALGTEEVYGRQKHVLLLTDGQPEPEHLRPREGELQALQNLREQKYTATVSTFGFGYNLNTRLLRELAEETGGTYSFIPDAGFVGCAFTHALTNIQCTASPQTKVTVTVDGSAFESGERALIFDMGPVMYGQKRTITMPAVMGACTINAQVELQDTIKGPLTIPAEPTTVTREQAREGPSSELQRDLVHSALVTALKEIEGKMEIGQQAKAERIRQELKNKIDLVLAADRSGEAQLDDATRAYIEACKEDIDDGLQVAQAMDSVERGWYRKWGRHYLPSIRLAHQLQQCNNFKDPGVQAYGGDMFRQLLDIADEAFVSLPPPVPARQASTPDYSQRRASAPAASYTPAAQPRAQPAPPVDMTNYYDRYAG